MPSLTRKKQVAVLSEGVAGTTPAGVGAAANATLLVTDPQLSPNPSFVERTFARDTLTAIREVPSLKIAAFTGRSELIGATSGGVPAWAPYLRSCGFRQVNNTSSVAIGSITGGPFRHGEIVTGGTSTHTATVIHDWYDGAAAIYFEPHVAGELFASADVITGGSSGATATAGAGGAAKGRSWIPTSTVLKTIELGAAPAAQIDAGTVLEGATSGAVVMVAKTVTTTVGDTTLIYRLFNGGTLQASEDLDDLTNDAAAVASVDAGGAEAFYQGETISLFLYEDGVIKKVRGARGTFGLEFRSSEQAFWSWEHAGIWVEAVDGANLVGVPYETISPPLFVNSTLSAGDDTITTVAGEKVPCLETISVTWGATPEIRPDPTDAGGIRELWISGRQPTVSFDPEATLEDDYSWLTNFMAGTPSRLRCTIGSANGNRFLITMPGIQSTQNPAGDRVGIRTHQIQGRLTGGELTNLAGGAVTLSSYGGDNEFVITQENA